MPVSLQVRTQIKAPVEQVWAILIDMKNWKEWNPHIWMVNGKEQRVEQGKEIQISVDNNLTIRPQVISVRENQELVWTGVLFHELIFGGTHGFYITPDENGGTILIHKEDFTGCIPSIMSLLGMMKSVEKNYTEINEALKLKAEQ